MFINCAAHARESHFFELLNASLNKKVPNRTDAEFQQYYRVEYHDEPNVNKKFKFICVCSGKYTNTNKAQHFASNKHLLYMANQRNSNYLRLLSQ